MPSASRCQKAQVTACLYATQGLCRHGQGIGEAQRQMQETKQKMSKAFSGKYVSEETREKVRLANIGKKLSPETIKKREDTRRSK